MTGAARETLAPVGVLGGSFDPVHLGHLRCALEVTVACRLSGMRFVPSGLPPHRPAPEATAEQRLQMLRRAIAGESRFSIDDSELRRRGPSYTVDTLEALREQVGHQPVCLTLGADAFLGLPSWHRWRALPGLAHLVVVHRPGVRLEPRGELAELLAMRHSDDVEDLAQAPAGVIRLQPVTQLDVSSSAIRALVRAGGDPRYLVPEAVRELIIDSGCYRSTAEVQVRA